MSFRRCGLQFHYTFFRNSLEARDLELHVSHADRVAHCRELVFVFGVGHLTDNLVGAENGACLIVAKLPDVSDRPAFVHLAAGANDHSSGCCLTRLIDALQHDSDAVGHVPGTERMLERLHRVPLGIALSVGEDPLRDSIESFEHWCPFVVVAYEFNYNFFRLSNRSPGVQLAEVAELDELLEVDDLNGVGLVDVDLPRAPDDAWDVIVVR